MWCQSRNVLYRLGNIKIILYILCVTVTDPRVKALSARMALRLQCAYKSKTWSSYERMFKMFLMFCEFTGVNESNYTLNTVLCFIEFLVFNGLQHGSILNYLSAIQTMFKWFALPDRHFDNIRIQLLLKAVATTVRPAPKFKGLFTVDTLKKILCVTLTLPFSRVFKTIYLFAFFGFF